MLEIILCSLVTILPDYLFRRFVQGKRFGHEITLFSVWFELRWGIVTCLLLAISLITLVFYFHPSSTAVISVFRSVPILPQTSGRVAEIFVRGSEPVQAGAPLFRLADETQRTAVEAARRAISQIDAAVLGARADLAAAEARILEAEGNLRQTTDELATKQELTRRNNDVVSRREIERLQVTVQTRRAGVLAAQAELDKTVVRAGVAGRVEQFVLQIGDVVNPMMRPAGVLVPDGLGVRNRSLAAGFGQVEAQVMRVGMIAEATCASQPWTIIPMVVTQVQGFIAGGQIRSSDQLIDVQNLRAGGTVLVVLEPLYDGGLDGVLPGSSCIANAYTSNHDLIADPATGTLRAIGLHAVDAVGLVHAILLRMQALLLPFKALVFSGGH